MYNVPVRPIIPAAFRAANKEITELKIKKILAIVLTLAICLALIAGCGKKGSSDGQTPDSGKQSSDSSTPSGESKKDEGKKEDGKKDEGKNYR